MLLGAQIQVPCDITMQQRAVGHHLGVQPGAARDEAVEEAAMAVRPVHHRGDGQEPSVLKCHYLPPSAHDRRFRKWIVDPIAAAHVGFKLCLFGQTSNGDRSGFNQKPQLSDYMRATATPILSHPKKQG